MSRPKDETTAALRDIIRRGQELEPETVPLARCPGCGEFGVPPECRSYLFCLLCGWRGLPPELPRPEPTA
jgi:hypothetical protein